MGNSSTILTTVLLSHTARPVFVRETTNSSSDIQEIVMEDGDSTTTSSPPREIGMVSTDRRITLMVLPTHFMLKMTLTHSSTTPKIHQRSTILLERTQISSRRWETV